MADTDVFGILSLLLAAGGAAYLIRARVLTTDARSAEAPSDPPDSARTSRLRSTVPPKLLRPQSVPPPDAPDARGESASGLAAAKTSGNAPGRAMAPTLKSPSSVELDKKAGRSEREEAVPSTKPSEKAAGDDGGGPKADAAASPDKSAATPPAPSSQPVSSKPVPSQSAEIRKKVPGAARTLTYGVAIGSALATAPGKKDPKSAALKGAAKAKDAKPASSTPTPGGASAAKPASERAAKDKDVGPASAKTPAAKKDTPDPKAAAKSPPSSPDVPRIEAEIEDDEDVEPTKVGKVNRKEIQPSVDRIVFDEGADAAPTDQPAAVVHAIAQTDPGKRRKQNEDSFLTLEKHGVFVVADGMGGHRGGQHASKLAVSTLELAFESGRFEAAAHPNLPKRASELARAMQMANSAIFEEAKRRAELKGMGTTICAACFDADNRRMYIGHVGDSRCYRLRDGVMKQMTTDHTMADYGVAGPEGSHLSRALGVWPTVPIDIVMAEPKVGDLYVLCSDGLTKMLPDTTIATQLLHEEDSKAAVERLVFFANAHGGKDNITVILIRVVAPGWKPPTSA